MDGRHVAGGHKTQTGGTDERFQPTVWAEILDACTLDPQRQRELIGRIMGKYWKPVYAFLRRKGHGNEEAKDLTQGFFTEVVLGRELIQQADPRKGRFRTFLLTALERYVRGVHRKDVAAVRSPARPLVSLDAAASGEPAVPSHEPTPEAAFAQAWASQLLDEVIEAVAASCRQAKQEDYWHVFRRTVLEPTLAGTASPALSELCAELGIENEKRAANMNVTVKRRFRSVLEARVRQSVGSEADVAAEIRELMEILARPGAARPGGPRIQS
jgi:DNA-directed RNA polymerase specialized sigma24 family protein